MASMNIAIKKEAYDFLKTLKSRDQSFSDIILSFKKDSSSLLKYFGVLKNSDWKTKEKRMASLRDSFEARLR
ncbi:antitoxin VapB family protein [Candidatus Woesearchaeota archaeon]|nr:antitoxin VapB family protein [Candidatus Woesearchaeota archaeon]